MDHVSWVDHHRTRMPSIGEAMVHAVAGVETQELHLQGRIKVGMRTRIERMTTDFEGVVAAWDRRIGPFRSRYRDFDGALLHLACHGLRSSVPHIE